jgi:hypothetical protein
MDFLIEPGDQERLEFLEPALLAGEMNPGEDVRPHVNLGVEKRSLLLNFSCPKVQETDRDHGRSKIHSETVNRTGLGGGKDIHQMP